MGVRSDLVSRGCFDDAEARLRGFVSKLETAKISLVAAASQVLAYRAT